MPLTPTPRNCGGCPPPTILPLVYLPLASAALALALALGLRLAVGLSSYKYALWTLIVGFEGMGVRMGMDIGMGIEAGVHTHWRTQEMPTRPASLLVSPVWAPTPYDKHSQLSP